MGKTGMRGERGKGRESNVVIVKVSGGGNSKGEWRWVPQWRWAPHWRWRIQTARPRSAASGTRVSKNADVGAARGRSPNAFDGSTRQGYDFGRQ